MSNGDDDPLLDTMEAWPEGAPDAASQVIDVHPGTLIDRQYRVERCLGAGGMGQVFLARDEVLERDVAIKFLNPRVPVIESAVARFLTEARAMARVRHENVVSVYSLGMINAVPYMVMEYVDGCDLAAWLEGRESPSIDEAMGILQQVCRGVQAIHDAGAVHLDIKPSNILLGAGFRVTVGDLGLARFVRDTKNATDQLEIAGTPTHMAPEVIMGTVEPGLAPRADLYSLGVLAFQLMTGRVPFQGRTPTAVMARHVTDAPPAPSSLAATLPIAFDAAILSALAKNPRDRPFSAMTWLTQLLVARKTVGFTLDAPRVLIADDDAAFRRFACEVVGQTISGVNLTCADDGAHALAALDAAPYDVALLDLQMPGLNGMEVVAALSERPDHLRPQIVVITAVGSAADWSILARLGVDSFLVKPVTPGQITRTLQRLLSLRGWANPSDSLR